MHGQDGADITEVADKTEWGAHKTSAARQCKTVRRPSHLHLHADAGMSSQRFTLTGSRGAVSQHTLSGCCLLFADGAWVQLGMQELTALDVE